MNHSNDATIVKRFHIWGSENKIGTSTIHDAFFTNVNDMLPARNALREIYAESLERNIIYDTLNEMRNRGLPKEVYLRYLEEAIEKGLIPIVGKSRVGLKTLTDKDILKREDILKPINQSMTEDTYWYGVG